MYDPDNSEVACFDPNNNNISDSSPYTQIHPNNSHETLDEFQNPNLNNNNNNNVSHEMMGCYPNFDGNNNNNTTCDLLTLLQSSSSLPPPPGLGAFLGEINNPNNMNINMIHDPALAATLTYDPLFHLNLPPHDQPSPTTLLRDLMFQSLPHGYTSISNNVVSTIGDNGNCSIFGHMEVGEGSNNMNMNTNMNTNGGFYQENGMFEFTMGVSNNMEIDVQMGNKGRKNFVTEKQRRMNFNDKYDALKNLLPAPTKSDRASIVFDAIKYINELKRTVGELKLLVENKRISKERTKRLKTEDNSNPDEAFAGSAATQLRSSWLQRKCKDTEVDVRIVDDEVTIKLVQRKKINCLLTVSRTLDDLRLDLRHVAGGPVGDYFSYLFNSKICEGSTVYASAIANKLIEVVERQYAVASS